MGQSDNIEEFAKAMAYAIRQPNDISNDADDYWGYTCRASQETWKQAAAAGLRVLPSMIAPLVWEMDGNKVRLDDRLMFQKGYDYDGLTMARQEAYGLASSYLIWPDSIASKVFSLYRSCDGAYIQDLSEKEAYDAANTHHRAAIMVAFTGETQ
jgi:hypothetical protein